MKVLCIYERLPYILVYIALRHMLLSRFSRVRLCATPWTAAYQGPPSMGFSRQEYWSGLLLLSLGGILVDISQMLKDYVIKVLHSLCQQIWKT